MITDKNKSITAISYNHLNLPYKVTFANGGNISFVYDAAGIRLSKKVQPNGGALVTTDYVNIFHYENNALKFFKQPEGFVEYKNNQYIYNYIYKDHLGNNRLVYADLNKDGVINPATEIIEENNYYPFGLKHKGYNELSTENPAGHKYKFQEQERNEELGLNWDSFKWRNYDYAIGRFMNIDPLSEKYPYNSTYAFQENKMGLGRELEGLELVLTHGTFAQREDRKIYSLEKADYKGGSTWERLFSQRVSLATGWNKDSTYEFTWSGENTAEARNRGGEMLAKGLMSSNNPFAEDKHVTLMGHSHGGNVNKVAKNILEENGWTVDIINIATPQRKDFQQNKTGDGVNLNFYSTGDAVQWFGVDDNYYKK